MRQTGFALLFASVILGVFLLIPQGYAVPTVSSTDMETATSTTPTPFTKAPITAKAAIVYDLTTEQVLFAKNADAQLPLASLTKILTVYAAVATLGTDATVTIPEDATRVDAPRLFQTGQTFALSDLAELTLTASLNDGAAAIASATAAYEQRSTYDALAGAAAALNLSQTYAVNGSGLDVSPSTSGGYGSAYDLARLSGALVATAPAIAQATTQMEISAASENGRSFTVKNTDPMVGSFPRLLLSKTGYTDLAGGNLALVFDVGIGHPVAVVVLGSTKKERFTDASALVSATFAHFAGVPSL